jgi:magnesium chelatase family protein
VPVSAIADGEPGEASAGVRERVCAARAVQLARYGAPGPRTNADLRGRAVNQFCRPDAAGRDMLRRAAGHIGLTARGYDRVLKVARTIADLCGAAQVDADHVAEALQYRMVE